VSREVAATTPPSRPPRSWNGEGEVLGVVPLLRAVSVPPERLRFFFTHLN